MSASRACCVGLWLQQVLSVGKGMQLWEGHDFNRMSTGQIQVSSPQTVLKSYLSAMDRGLGWAWHAPSLCKPYKAPVRLCVFLATKGCVRWQLAAGEAAAFHALFVSGALYDLIWLVFPPLQELLCSPQELKALANSIDRQMTAIVSGGESLEACWLLLQGRNLMG